MEKLHLRQYTSFDLLELAIVAVKEDLTSPKEFKNHFKVDFTFLQLCNLLTRRTIWNKPVLTKDEYETISSDPYDKEALINLFNRVKSRNKITITTL